jgi:hypothetical protein
LESASPVPASTTFDDLPEEVVVNILRFIPSRALLTTVSLVNGELSRLVNESRLWHHIHFRATDSCKYIAAVLARFRNSVRSVTIQCRKFEVILKVGVLIGSQIAFEEVCFIVVGAFSEEEFDIHLVLQELGDSTKTLSFGEPCSSSLSIRPMSDLPPGVRVQLKPRLLSLDLSTVSDGLDDEMIKAIVASCPQLELLHIGHHGSSYTSVGIRSIADGLPNLVSVILVDSTHDNEACRYLLSKRPGLSALGLELRGILDVQTAVQISQMRDLQYLHIMRSCWIGSADHLKAVFENATFGHLKSLRLMESRWVDKAVLKAIALACPKLEQLMLRWIVLAAPPSSLDDAIKLICESCPELRVFWTLGLPAVTGERWLDTVATLLPNIRCVAVTTMWDDEACAELLERADRARASNPKLCVMIGSAPHQFNEDVAITSYDVLDVLAVPPRLCDQRAGRVRFPNVLQETARSQLAKRE